MFDLSLVFIIVVASLLLGPKELPLALKTLGKVWAKLLKFSHTIRYELDKTMDYNLNGNKDESQNYSKHDLPWIDLPKQKSQKRWN